MLSWLLRLRLAVTFSQTSLVSDDLDIFKRYWSGVLQGVSPLGPDVFLMVRLGLCIWGWEITEVNYHFPHDMARVHTVNTICDY